MNFASTDTLKIQCKNKISQIESIRFIGIASSQSAQCSSLLRSKEEELAPKFLESCYWQNETKKAGLFANGTEFEDLVKQKCIGKSTCNFTVEELGLNQECQEVLEERRSSSQFSRNWIKQNKTISKTFVNSYSRFGSNNNNNGDADGDNGARRNNPQGGRTPGRAGGPGGRTLATASETEAIEPIVFAMATCLSDYLEIDFTHIDRHAYVKITKNDFGLLIVLIDMIIIVLYVIFINRLET